MTSGHMAQTATSAALALAVGLIASGTVKAEDCSQATDFLTLSLSEAGSSMQKALELAYPGLSANEGTITVPGGKTIAIEPARQVSPAERLENATIGDMFTYIYPISFEFEKRKAPFYDPGRVRNEPFFRAVFFNSKNETQKSLTTVKYKGRKVSASFHVSKKYCIHTQLKAALDEIASAGSYDKFFQKTGGSFAWRTISGTKRLSSHSFGSAVDINSQLGKYWKWAGVKPGHAARYDNAIPEGIVKAFERRGFIWGGKWHHFDGMHFEYRPELILYSRMVGG
ncbi:M15 family metallopeptidase [uncultured Cohaesibacter sp.]|uniref:M15 family metallopeptidase n=1 Tax=uncultured Cohaesibacter sp. TaxID=1002546 RepID=UPI0029C7DF94|nr:M15 family metallopeptidase [uncultured Cohaesibacter sp.]